VPRRVLIAVACVALLTAACGSAGSTAKASSGTSPLPAGPTPSPISKLVCQNQAKQDIASALGETASVSTPTWSDHLYGCDYRYPTGSIKLSIKELSSWAQTYAYFDGLAAKLGKTRNLQALGQGAFQTTDGSVVVRKDWKVLLVDTSGLPAQFGVPPTSSGDVAVTVGDIILGCWSGD
jgi:hypothetical protein